jgi:hypothetical protein
MCLGAELRGSPGQKFKESRKKEGKKKGFQELPEIPRSAAIEFRIRMRTGETGNRPSLSANPQAAY